METSPRLVACHDCDYLLRLPRIAPGQAARCPRCNALLARPVGRTIERTCALVTAALVLFVAANAFPLLTLKIQGTFIEATILSGCRTLWNQDKGSLAVLVFLTTIAAPLAHMLALLYVLAPLGMGYRMVGAVRLFRVLGHVRTWSMAEVFMLGVLVSLVKLADMAEIVPGIALWSLALLIPVLTASLVTLDPDAVWERLVPMEPAEART